MIAHEGYAGYGRDERTVKVMAAHTGEQHAAGQWVAPVPAGAGDGAVGVSPAGNVAAAFAECQAKSNDVIRQSRELMMSSAAVRLMIRDSKLRFTEALCRLNEQMLAQAPALARAESMVQREGHAE